MSAEHHARVKELFLAAKEQPVDRRDAWLAQACDDDPALADEVRSLLGRLDDTPTPAYPGGDDPSATPALPRTESPRFTLDNYRVLQKLGEGGMGEVYEAEQLEPVRRRVALKVLKGGLASREVLARFDLERQALALMSHPNIARVFEAGITREGSPYFAMERVHGEPITAYCDRHRLDNTERLALVLEVCAGVQHAHQKGIIHRDLKPSNILVSVEDGGAVPKIIDFGVAKATGTQLTEQTVFTQMGQWIGTPEYMSPEQAEMTGLDIDTRTDVYALGVLLYELLTGAKPFDSSSLRGAGFDEVRRRIREDEPTRPSTKVSGLGESSKQAAQRRQTDVASLVQQLRGDLDWITLKALEKDRTRRYASPMDLASDLRRHLDHEPVLACPPSTAYKVGKFVRRNRLAVLASGLVLAAVLLGLAMTGWALVHARAEARRAQQVAGFLEQMLGDFNPFINQSAVSMETLLDNAAARIDRELQGQELVQARLLLQVGMGFKDLGRFERAHALLDRSVQLFEEQLGSDSAEVAWGLSELGWLAWESGDYRRSLELHQQVAAIRQRVLDPDDPRLAQSDSHLGFAHWALGDFERSETFFERAVAAEEGRLVQNPIDLARVLMLQAVLFNNQGNYSGAQAAAQRAIDLRVAALGPDHLHVGWALRTLARCQRLQGDAVEALATGERALELLEASLDAEHSDLAFALATLGAAHRDLGHWGTARELLDRAITLREEALGAEHPEVAQALVKRAVLDLETGDAAAAGPRLERALETARRILPAEHPEIFRRLHWLSRQRRATGALEEAQSLQREALEGARAALGEGHPLLADHLANLGGLLRQTGELEAARSNLEAALATHRDHLGPDHRAVVDDLVELALLDSATGDIPEADRRFVEALSLAETSLGAEHPALARGLRAQAEHLRRTERTDTARRAERRAASIEALASDR